MADPAWTQLGLAVTICMIVLILAFLWVTNPKHHRTRRAVAVPVHLLIGLAVRIGLID